MICTAAYPLPSCWRGKPSNANGCTITNQILRSIGCAPGSWSSGLGRRFIQIRRLYRGTREFLRPSTSGSEPTVLCTSMGRVYAVDECLLQVDLGVCHGRLTGPRIAALLEKYWMDTNRVRIEEGQREYPREVISTPSVRCVRCVNSRCSSAVHFTNLLYLYSRRFTIAAP